MPKSAHGFALVIVIWVLTLLSLMAGSFALTMRRADSVTMALKNNAQAEALTESSFTQAKYMLQQPDPNQRWLADGSIYRIVRNDGSEIRISITAESAKIDLNQASPELLAAAIDMISSDKWQQQALLNSILDWRDADDETRPHGAEKKQYQDAGLTYSPSNQPFQSLDELLLVQGMDEQTFNRLQPWLTVYSGQNQVDMEMASPEVQLIVNNALLSGNAPQQTGGRSPSPPLTPAVGTQNNSQAANNQNTTYTIIVETQTEDGGSASLEVVTQLQGGGNPPPVAAGGQNPPAGQALASSQLSSATQNQGGTEVPAQVLDWRQNQLKKSLFAIEMEARLITVHDEFTNHN